MDIVEQMGVLVKDKLDRIYDSNRVLKQDVQFLRRLIVDLKLFQIRTNGGIDDYNKWRWKVRYNENTTRGSS